MAFEVTQFGGNLHHWHIEGDEYPILFVSSGSTIQDGVALRGGVPICFPWFGPKEGKPQHGFVRLMKWEVIEECETHSILKFTSNDATKEIWNHDFEAILKVTEGLNTLSLEIEVVNIDKESFEFTFAFHTYFLVSDIATIAIEGLEGIDYIDKNDNFEWYEEDENMVLIDEATDRIYATANTTFIHDEGWARKIKVSHQGSDSVVVWNPWHEKAKNIKDLGEGQYRDFVCVETAVTQTPIKLEQGKSYKITQRIEVLSM